MTQIKFLGMMRVSDVSIADLDQTAQETKPELDEIFTENNFRVDKFNFGSTDTWDAPEWIDLTIYITSEIEHDNPKEAEMLAKQSAIQIENTITQETRVNITGREVQ